MAQFDPLLREVTVVLQNVGRSVLDKRRPVYRRAGFNLVSYDGAPERVVEPVNACLEADAIADSATVFSSATTRERIVGFEYIEGRMSEVHSFSPDVVDV